ncbi:MerC domain-containing protein [Arenimonas fontis]|uniref:MerC domain-containing protein n=1 Tax=Arenimonas fontis TaxID=2608255 RepID=A0A5B2ZCS9_9GAMM|nr:MerC domain-containing protein [Arenimonas fontis]KAA2285807.1 MerC domain-containing protein [Arenimonas fontis]
MSTPLLPRRFRLPPWADRLGAFGAFLCAAHCALIPLALALLPAMGLGVLAWHGFELGFGALATVLAVGSLWAGYRSHRAYHAWLLVAPGLALVWLATLYPPLHDAPLPHALMMTVGGVLIGLAHLVNLRLSWGHSH